MIRVAYLRDQAARFRDLARTDGDPNIRRQLVALAKQCEEIAMAIEDGPTYKKSQRAPVSGKLRPT
jgi:hypothetical protein